MFRGDLGGDSFLFLSVLLVQRHYFASSLHYFQPKVYFRSPSLTRKIFAKFPLSIADHIFIQLQYSANGSICFDNHNENILF